MVGYIEICEINGLGQEAETLCFLANIKRKELCGYIFCLPRMHIEVFLYRCIVLVKRILYKNTQEALLIFFTHRV